MKDLREEDEKPAKQQKQQLSWHAELLAAQQMAQMDQMGALGVTSAGPSRQSHTMASSLALQTGTRTSSSTLRAQQAYQAQEDQTGGQGIGQGRALDRREGQGKAMVCMLPMGTGAGSERRMRRTKLRPLSSADFKASEKQSMLSSEIVSPSPQKR